MPTVTEERANRVVNTYEDVWHLLNQIDLTPIPEDGMPGEAGMDFETIFQYFKTNAASKVINLRKLSGADEEYLERHGLSPVHLGRNLRRAIKARYFDVRKFQINAIKDTAIYAICPFTGRSIQSKQSLLANINCIFYRFRSEQIFYVATAGIGSGFTKCALYFPEMELIVTLGDAWTFEEADLTELKARMVCNYKRCWRYVAEQDEEKRKAAVCVGFYHFAHHLWNELSGLHRLHQEGLLEKVEKFLVLREPLGDISRIFFEIRPNQIERRGTADDLFSDILSNNYFAIRIGDDFIAHKLAKRVQRVAVGNCRPATLAAVREARSGYSPLLWVGIRVGSRTWADQVDGLANLIAALHTRYPKLAVVFDGFSVPGDKSTEEIDAEEYADLIGGENEVVDAIIERLERRPEGRPGIVNLIGSSIFDAIVWAHAIDVYVSPYGTLQHKVGWFTDKPGVIHANQTLLDNPPKYVWASVENAAQPRYVRRGYISDIRNAKKAAIAYKVIRDANQVGAGVEAANKKVEGNPEFDNYSVEWRGLYDDLLDLIDSPKLRFKLARPMLVNSLKRRARKTLLSVTNRLYPSKI